MYYPNLDTFTHYKWSSCPPVRGFLDEGREALEAGAGRGVSQEERGPHRDGGEKEWEVEEWGGFWKVLELAGS